MSQLQVTGEAKIRDIQGPVVANSGVITALDGAASQYVRGDGTLADFPTSTGGGSSVSYYLNSSVSQGTIGGVAYRELSKEPIIGAGTDITISANGYVASYITDANDPDVLSVPGGNFNCEFYFSVNNNTGNPTTYAELYKYDGTTFTLLGSSQAVPESLNQGTTIAPYYFAIPVATAALALTDRLAIRIYVSVDGRVVTLHTENSHLCQVVTTFSKGMVSLNNLTDQSQFITTGTSGTNFNIVSSGDTHTFNLPVASATNTGKLSNTDWSTFNNKVPYTGATGDVNLGLYNISAQNAFLNGVSGVNGGNLFLKHGNNFITTSNYTTIYSLGNNIGFVSNDGTYTKEAFISLSLIPNNQTRSYSFPDQSGTLALLEGTQTFSGAKTFSGLAIFTNTSGINLQYGAYINKGNTPLAFSSVTTNIYSDATTNNIVIRDNSSIAKLEFNNSTQTYTFPATSGTIALTSNIPANIITGTGTTNTLPKFTGTSTVGNSNITDTGSLITLGSNVTTTGSQFVQNGFYLTNSNAGALAGYTNMWGADDGIFFGLRNLTGGAKFVFQSATSYNYTFPAATGTLALTSNLSAYLPLTGGTLTGPLSGTTADFSGLGTFYQLTMTGATAGRIFYAQTGGVVSQSGNLNWNETNGMLGVGTPNPSAVITAFSNNAATQFKAAGTAPAFTFSQSLTTSTYACVFGLATSANHFITGTAAGDMAIANQSTTAGAIVFGTGTAEKMRMSSSGNFGIGISIPTAKVHAVNSGNGFIYRFAGGTSSEIAGGIFASTAAGFASIGTTSNHTFNIFTNDTDRLTISASGAATFSSSVFIGSSITSAATLHVNNALSADPTSLSSVPTTNVFGMSTSPGAMLAAGIGTSGGSHVWLQGRNTGGAGVSYPISLQPLGGNVGIGTSSPIRSLQINAANTITDDFGQVFISTNNAQGAGIGGQLTLGGFWNGSAQACFAGISGRKDNGTSGDPAGYLSLYTLSGSLQERLRITSGGNVLIGTTTDYGYRTTISGLNVLYLRSTSNTNGSNAFVIQNSTPTDLFVVRNDGLISTGLAANSPYNNTTGGGANAIFASDGTLQRSTSSLKYKTDVRDYDKGLAEVMQIRPVYYKGKNDGDTQYAGLIAEEINDLGLVEFVQYAEDKTPDAIYYANMVALLVKGMQEQQAQIEELKTKINK